MILDLNKFFIFLTRYNYYLDDVSERLIDIKTAFHCRNAEIRNTCGIWWLSKFSLKHVKRIIVNKNIYIFEKPEWILEMLLNIWNCDHRCWPSFCNIPVFMTLTVYLEEEYKMRMSSVVAQNWIHFFAYHVINYGSSQHPVYFLTT